jgi:lysophospholipase L1-like esterase
MQFFKDLLRAGAAVCICLLALEAAMRVEGLKYDGSFYTFDPVRLYALRPGASGWVEGEGETYITINSDGMLDREHTLAKPSGITRIAFLGDSETNADHLPFDENMVQLAQKELWREPGRVELLNFAVGGYTLPQQIYTFRDRAAKYHPEIVILMLSPAIIRASNRVLNTFDSPSPSFILRGGSLVPDPLSPVVRAPTPLWLAVRNRLAQIQNDVRLLALAREAIQTGLRQKLPQIQALFRGNKAAASSGAVCSCAPPRTAKMEDAWQISAALIDWLNETVRARGARLWIVSLGDGSQIVPDPQVRASMERHFGTADLDYADRRLGAIATRLGIPFLPVAPMLLDYAIQHHAALRGSERTPPYEGHLNREGHRVLGPALAELIRASLHQPLCTAEDTSKVTALLCRNFTWPTKYMVRASRE